MNWKPNKWIAALLGFFFTPIGMLYVTKAKWAIVYLIIPIALIVFVFIWAQNMRIYLDWVSLGISIIGAIHAFWVANVFPSNLQRPWYSHWYALTLIPALFFGVWFALRIFIWDTFHMPGTSMLPTIKVGDMLVVKKWGCGNYDLFSWHILTLTPNDTCLPQRGEIFAFQFPEDPSITYIKRIIGLPGDRVHYDGIRLSINGNVMTDPESTGKYTDAANDLKFSILSETLDTGAYDILLSDQVTSHKSGEWQVPEGQYFVMGDNRDRSNDSRMWGFVPQKNLIGKLVYQFQLPD